MKNTGAIVCVWCCPIWEPEEWLWVMLRLEILQWGPAWPVGSQSRWRLWGSPRTGSGSHPALPPGILPVGHRLRNFLSMVAWLQPCWSLPGWSGWSWVCSQSIPRCSVSSGRKYLFLLLFLGPQGEVSAYISRIQSERLGWMWRNHPWCSLWLKGRYWRTTLLERSLRLTGAFFPFLGPWLRFSRSQPCLVDHDGCPLATCQGVAPSPHKEMWLGLCLSPSPPPWSRFEWSKWSLEGAASRALGLSNF